MSVKTVKVNINGQDHNLSYNSTSGKWEATITAPSTSSWNQPSNKYGLTVTATDDAGNATTKDRSDSSLGSILQLRVLEKVKPTVVFTSPSSGARVTSASPNIQFQLRDSESGIKISTLKLRVDGGTVITNVSSGMTCTSVSGGYNCSYIPTIALVDGAHTVTVQVEDNDGNIADVASVAFNIDTVPPQLNITSPVNNLTTNNSNLIVNGTTNDITSSPVAITIKNNSVDQGAVTVQADGNFSKAITLSEGENIIEIKAVASAGLTSVVTRNITLDTKAPTIGAVTVTPNPVDSGKTFIITVTVSD